MGQSHMDQSNIMRPIDPKSIHFTDKNETIMVDDAVPPIYDQSQKHRQTAKQARYGSVERLIENDMATTPRRNEKIYTDNYNERKMRQELSGEDVYTLRFSTTLPIEPFDVTAPKQQQSYMYNGSVNRPAFEIVSHADVRPATPIQFEEAKELKPKKRKSSASPPKKWRHENGGAGDEIHYKERISMGPGCFESASWVESSQKEPRSTCGGVEKKRLKYARSHTSPLPRLNYGCEKSVRSTGEPVQWHVAGELRTTDWDKLKTFSSMEHAQTRQHMPHGYFFSNGYIYT